MALFFLQYCSSPLPIPSLCRMMGLGHSPWSITPQCSSMKLLPLSRLKVGIIDTPLRASLRVAKRLNFSINPRKLSIFHWFFSNRIEAPSSTPFFLIVTSLTFPIIIPLDFFIREFCKWDLGCGVVEPHDPIMGRVEIQQLTEVNQIGPPAYLVLPHPQFQRSYVLS